MTFMHDKDAGQVVRIYNIWSDYFNAHCKNERLDKRQNVRGNFFQQLPWHWGKCFYCGLSTQRQETKDNK